MLFAQNLKELRKKHHLSQDALAMKLNVSQQAVGKWETEKSFPDFKMLIQLADFFHVSIDYLLGHEVAQPDPPADTSEPADIKELIAKELPNMDAEDAAMMGQFMQFLKIKKGFGAKTANGNL